MHESELLEIEQRLGCVTNTKVQALEIGGVQVMRSSDILTLIAEIRKLQFALTRLRTTHYECEDCWYSCPMSGECCDEFAKSECTCGVERTNAVFRKLAEVLKKHK